MDLRTLIKELDDMLRIKGNKEVYGDGLPIVDVSYSDEDRIVIIRTMS